MEVRIETDFLPLIYGSEDLPRGVTAIHLPPPPQKSDFSSDPIAVAVLSIASNLALNVFANWLYDKLKHSPHATLKINCRYFAIERGTITRVLSEEVQMEATSRESETMEAEDE